MTDETRISNSEFGGEFHDMDCHIEVDENEVYSVVIQKEITATEWMKAEMTLSPFLSDWE